MSLTPNDLLIRVTSAYFKSVSENHDDLRFSFQDCSVELADKEERDLGVFMAGYCKAEHDQDITTYYVALNGYANNLHSSYEVIEK